MARPGFTSDEIVAILGISHPAKASQAINPALEKIAKLWRADPTKTLMEILDYVERLTPMPDDELETRRAMLAGRIERSIVHPHRSSASDQAETSHAGGARATSTPSSPPAVYANRR